ncbi:MAG: DUF58 domain-containing protein [bacterium]
MIKLPDDSIVKVYADDLIHQRLSVRGLKFPPAKRVQSMLAGNHHSQFRGRGVDYMESRHYLPGDDIRNMDWRVTARTGKAYTKVFQEERERPVILLLDCNASMFFATRGSFKSVQAARLAALLGWITTTRGDRIGALAFHGEKHSELRPAGGRRGAMRLVRQLTQWYNNQPEKPSFSGMGNALARLRSVARPGSLVVVISDFYAMDNSTERHLMRLRHHNDMVFFAVNDPIEQNTPEAASYHLTDGSGQFGSIDLTRTNARQIWREQLIQRFSEVEKLALKVRAPLIYLPTDRAAVDIVRNWSL